MAAARRFGCPKAAEQSQIFEEDDILQEVILRMNPDRWSRRLLTESDAEEEPARELQEKHTSVPIVTAEHPVPRRSSRTCHPPDR